MISKSYSSIQVVNDEVLAATTTGEVLILNDELIPIKQYNTAIERCANCLDGNEQYLAVGYIDGHVWFNSRIGEDESTVSKQLIDKILNSNLVVQTRSLGPFYHGSWKAVG